jgi:hypothetical protein
MDTLSSKGDENHSIAGPLSSFEKWIPIIFKALGVALIVLAMTSYMTKMTLLDLLHYAEQIFSYTFISLFVPLVLCAVYAIAVLHRQDASKAQKIFWYEVGQQSANGIASLALTFTLLGISVGIGTMSKQSLTPESVNQVITALTQQFSMAFMTTIVGLPTATLCRALLSISMIKPQKQRHNDIDSFNSAKEKQDDTNS